MKFFVLSLYGMFLIGLILGVVILAGTTSLGFLGWERFGMAGWFFDLFSHFRLQYCLAQSALFLILLILWGFKAPYHKFVLALLCTNLVFWLANVMVIAPYYLPQPPHKIVDDRIRMLHLNVYGKNRNSDAVVQVVKEAKADIIDFQEYNSWWRTTLEKGDALADYPYRYHVQWGDDAIYSKRPLRKVHQEHIADSPHGADVSIVAEIVLADQPVTLLFSHPPTPIKLDLYHRLKQHYAFWGQKRKTYHENLVIIGDLNSTAWSAPFRKLLRQTGLRDSQLGFGVQPSFPAYSRLKRVSIDHFLVSPSIVVLNRKVGHNVGSDHYPVTIELGLKN